MGMRATHQRGVRSVAMADGVVDGYGEESSKLVTTRLLLNWKNHKHQLSPAPHVPYRVLLCSHSCSPTRCHPCSLNVLNEFPPFVPMKFLLLFLKCSQRVPTLVPRETEKRKKNTRRVQMFLKWNKNRIKRNKMEYNEVKDESCEEK